MVRQILSWLLHIPYVKYRVSAYSSAVKVPCIADDWISQGNMRYSTVLLIQQCGTIMHERWANGNGQGLKR